MKYLNGKCIRSCRYDCEHWRPGLNVSDAERCNLGASDFWYELKKPTSDCPLEDWYEINEKGERV